MARKYEREVYRAMARKAAKVAKRYLFAMPEYKTKGREAVILRRAYRTGMTMLAAA